MPTDFFRQTKHETTLLTGISSGPARWGLQPGGSNTNLARAAQGDPGNFYPGRITCPIHFPAKTGDRHSPLCYGNYRNTQPNQPGKRNPKRHPIAHPNLAPDEHPGLATGGIPWQ